MTGITNAGGSSIQFAVVNGTTQPTVTSPTLWCNTASDLSGNVFISNSVPDSAVTGDLRILYGISSNADIAVTDYISVLPAGVYRYNGSTWDSVQSQYWDGSAWSSPYSLVTTLYNAGVYSPQLDDATARWIVESSGTSYYVVENTTNIEIKRTAISRDFTKGITVYPIYIDSTVSYLKAELQCINRVSRTSYLGGIGISKSQHLTSASSLYKSSTVDLYGESAGTKLYPSINLSGAEEGYYYIYFFLNTSDSGGVANFQLNKLWTT